ncbi:MAG: Ldh family oxidoreductase [Chlorobi bacterium]|nr:Ldh family oxidoreductase [Chlorobiota bacterium]
MNPSTKYDPAYLRDFVTRFFERLGCPRHDAEAIADVFIRAELRNLPSHGMIRIKDHFQLWEAGRLNIKPDIRIVHESPGTAVVDGDNAVGMLAAYRSMEIAIEKSEKAGSGWVATRNSNHFSIGSYYAMMALEHDMIGLAMTNGNPLVAPVNSTERMLGTNPIAVAVPAGKQPPFVGDFSTTPIARGKLGVAAKKGKKIPFGYVIDKNGNPSDDPDILKEGGAMVPLGGDIPHGSHKGYALGSIVDILTGVLSGANFGPFVPPNLAYLPIPEVQVGKGMGHFFGAWRIDAFMEAGEFKSRMDRWINVFRKSRPAPGKKVLIPGDIEREAEIRLAKEGISVLPAIQKDVKEVADKLGIEFRVLDS